MGRATAQAIRCQSLFEKTRIQPHANNCETYDRQSCRETGFFPNTSAVPYHYHSTNVSCSL